MTQSGSNRQGLALLILAQAISVTGDMVLLTAASIAIYRVTGSATSVSLLLGLAAIPTLLLGPIGGTFADWFPRRRILVGADLVAALACFAAFGLAASASTTTTAFVAVAAVASLGAFYRPAAQALLPALASRDQLGRANSALRLATSLANIVGPALAAFMIARGGLDFVLAADAASFLVSAGLVLMITRVPAQQANGARRNPFPDAWAGLSYVRRHGPIRTVTLAIGVVMLVGTLVNTGTLPLVSESLALPESRYGTLLAIEGVGAMVLAVLFVIVGPGRKLLVTGAFALIGTGATTLLLSSARGFELAAGALLLQGASVVALQVALSSYLQREAADAFRGRVMALVGMVASLAQIAGYAVAGPLIEWLGPRSALVIAGLAVCFVAVPVVSLAFTMARAERTAPAPSA
ncbi:MAG: MFS transporter [Dehalococcoidia bacterium]|nr:MFS transporter [Dehalococcoidia bacterium]